MRKKTAFLLAGAAALMLIGSSAIAAPARGVHTMTVQLPGGGVAHIAYTGDVAPRVSFAPIAPVMAFGAPFGAFDRIADEMDREMDAMMRAAFAEPSQLMHADFGDLGAGSSSFSEVSTLTPHGFCSQSVEITQAPGEKAPHVTRRTAGNCGAAAPDSGNASATAPAPSRQSGLTQAKAVKPKALHRPASNI